MNVMSATQSRFGAAAEKSRSTRSGAGRASLSRRVVTTVPRRRLTPTIPAARISRATGDAVSLVRRHVDGLDPLHQHPVSDSTSGRRTTEPRIVARLGHAEHACHRCDREYGLVRAHEPEDPDAILPVSRANQAAAFARISRS